MQPEPPQVLLLLLELRSGLPSPRAGFVAHQNFLAAAKMPLVGWGADEFKFNFGLGSAAEGDLEGAAFVSASSELGSPPLLVAE